MSATPNNTNPRFSNEGDLQDAGYAGAVRPPSYHAPGREALQALLAFSSLHDQIRRRNQRGNDPRERRIALIPAERFVPDEVLQLISDRALAITGTDGIAIALVEGNEVRCRAASGAMAPDVGVRLDPNSGFSGACFRTGLIVRCDDTEKDPRVDQEACRRIGVRSIVAVPLLTEQGVVGLIAAFCHETHGVSDGDIRSLSLLAELALAALQPDEEGVLEDRPQHAADLSVLNDEQYSDEQYSGNEIAPVASREQQNNGTAEGTASESKSANVALPNLALPNLEALRSTLSPVTEERLIVDTPPVELREAALPEVFTTPEEPGKSRGLLAAIVVLILLTLVLAGVALWWWQSAGHAKARTAPPASARRNAPPVVNAPSEPVPAQSGVETAAEAPKESAGREITGIRHWSSADSSTVAIDLQEQVQYEAHRLSNPERIYFDLRDTSIAGGLPGNVEVDDALLSRIRIAHPSADVTRVVLETKNNSNFSVKLETNPYRLLIEVRGAGAKPKPSAKVDLFAPLNATEKNQRMADSTPEQGNWLAPATTASNLQPPASGPGHGMRIVLDAGHGGWDMGTVGQKGLLEKDLVLDIVARLGKLVTDRLGAEVIYTRRDDTYIPLEKRTETANFAQADLFLSVHANYSDSPAARGVETYYTNTYSSARSHMPDTGAPEALNVEWLNVDIRGKVQQSRGFAATVQQSLYRALAVKSPELRNRGVKEASYVVLTGTTMPAILAEVSFVSSPEDEAKLESAAYRQEIAEGLYKGIAAYADTQRHVNVASALNRSGGQ